MKVLKAKENAKGEVVAEILLSGEKKRGGMKFEMTRQDVVQRAIDINDDPRSFGSPFSVKKMCTTLVAAHSTILDYEEKR